MVIGSGFGGPVAAKKCADAGLCPLMLERSEIVCEKVVSGLTIPIYGFFSGLQCDARGSQGLQNCGKCLQHCIFDAIPESTARLYAPSCYPAVLMSLLITWIIALIIPQIFPTGNIFQIFRNGGGIGIFNFPAAVFARDVGGKFEMTHGDTHVDTL